MNPKSRVNALIQFEGPSDEWLRKQKEMIRLHCGYLVGCSTIVRAAVAGLAEAGIDFSDCQSEHQVKQKVFALARTSVNCYPAMQAEESKRRQDFLDRVAAVAQDAYDREFRKQLAELHVNTPEA